MTIRAIAGCLTLAVTLAACAPVDGLRNVASAGGSLVNAVVEGGNAPGLSTEQLRTLQTREFSTTKAAGFASVMTTLLDAGFRVQTADLDSGLITASASTTGRLRLDTGGLGRLNETPLASIFVEDRGDGIVRVRAAFSMGRSASGALASTGERAVTDPQPYATFFDRLTLEIAQRPAPPPAPLSTPAPAPAPDPPAATPLAAEPDEVPNPDATTEEQAGEANPE